MYPAGLSRNYYCLSVYLPSHSCPPAWRRSLTGLILMQIAGKPTKKSSDCASIPANRSWRVKRKADPGNLIPYFLENYIDFFTLYFNEDPEEYKRRKTSTDQRMAMMKKGDPSSPFYLFTRSVIYFQWAAVEIKFGDRWDAAWSFRRSFLAGKENLEKFPGFRPGRMLQGAMQVAAGTIPPGYQWLSSFWEYMVR